MAFSHLIFFWLRHQFQRDYFFLKPQLHLAMNRLLWTASFLKIGCKLALVQRIFRFHLNLFKIFVSSSIIRSLDDKGCMTCLSTRFDSMWAVSCIFLKTRMKLSRGKCHIRQFDFHFLFFFGFSSGMDFSKWFSNPLVVHFRSGFDVPEIEKKLHRELICILQFNNQKLTFHHR